MGVDDASITDFVHYLQFRYGTVEAIGQLHYVEFDEGLKDLDAAVKNIQDHLFSSNYQITGRYALHLCKLRRDTLRYTKEVTRHILE